MLGVASSNGGLLGSAIHVVANIDSQNVHKSKQQKVSSPTSQMKRTGNHAYERPRDAPIYLPHHHHPDLIEGLMQFWHRLYSSRIINTQR